MVIGIPLSARMAKRAGEAHVLRRGDSGPMAIRAVVGFDRARENLFWVCCCLGAAVRLGWRSFVPADRGRVGNLCAIRPQKARDVGAGASLPAGEGIRGEREREGGNVGKREGVERTLKACFSRSAMWD